MKGNNIDLNALRQILVLNNVLCYNSKSHPLILLSGLFLKNFVASANSDGKFKVESKYEQSIGNSLA